MIASGSITIRKLSNLSVLTSFNFYQRIGLVIMGEFGGKKARIRELHPSRLPSAICSSSNMRLGVLSILA